MSTNMKPLIDAGFHLKGLKKWNTPDGGGYTFTLTHHGKPVANVLNEGTGGATRVEWLGLRWDGSAMPGSDAKKAALTRQAATVFDAILKSLPPFESYGMTLKVDAGILLEELVNYVDLQKLCKSKTAFRLPEDTNGTYRVLKAPFDPNVRAYILSQWPFASILNENPFA